LEGRVACGKSGTEMTRGSARLDLGFRDFVPSSSPFKVDTTNLMLDHLATTAWSALQEPPSTAQDADVSRGRRVYAQISAARLA
jgi:hypothetical protein